MTEKQTTLLFVIKNNKILLALKKRGFGVGKFNGAGGKLEPGETVEQAMIRETQEEIAITPTQYQKWGVVKFNQFINNEPAVICTHIFTASDYTGEPQESEEMKPQWFNLDQIPYDQMYATDKMWLPIILNQQGYFEATFKYDPAGNMIDHTINIQPNQQ